MNYVHRLELLFLLGSEKVFQQVTSLLEISTSRTMRHLIL